MGFCYCYCCRWWCEWFSDCRLNGMVRNATNNNTVFCEANGGTRKKREGTRSRTRRRRQDEAPRATPKTERKKKKKKTRSNGRRRQTAQTKPRRKADETDQKQAKNTQNQKINSHVSCPRRLFPPPPLFTSFSSVLHRKGRIRLPLITFCLFSSSCWLPLASVA